MGPVLTLHPNTTLQCAFSAHDMKRGVCGAAAETFTSWFVRELMLAERKRAHAFLDVKEHKLLLQE